MKLLKCSCGDRRMLIIGLSGSELGGMTMSNAKRRHRRRYRRAHDRTAAIWIAEMKRRGLWEIQNIYSDDGRLHILRGGFGVF